MTISTYTKPAPTLTTSYRPLDPPRPFLPLLPPPAESSSSSTPRLLPLAPQLGPSHNPIPGYKLYRHSAVGAYPRSIDEAVLPEGSTPIDPLDDRFGSVTGKDSKDRRAQILKTSQAAFEIGEKARWRTKNEVHKIRERPLYLAVNRFVREGIKADEGEGATLILCHGNGFNKEMWEETVRQVLQHIGKGKIAGESKVDEIWFLDHHNEGESYLLNRERIGSRVSWADCGRDLAALLYHSLPPIPSAKPPAEVPEHLGYDRNTGLRNKRRKLVGIGHSVGGNAIVQCSQAFPNLFDSLILVDPMCRIVDETDATYGVDLVKSCIGRRNVWPSREDARKDLLRSPYFQVWHPRVFDAVIDHGLAPLSSVSSNSSPPGSTPTDTTNTDTAGTEGPVTLTTPRWMEAAMFTDYCGLTDGYDKLKYLREGMRVRMIMAGQAFATGGLARTHAMVLRPPTSDNVIIKEASHNVLQEHPKPLAEQIWRALMGMEVEVDEKFYADRGKL